MTPEKGPNKDKPNKDQRNVEATTPITDVEEIDVTKMLRGGYLHFKNRR